MLNPGETFGAYRIERELGRGGMGAVFEATHSALRKRVAIKVMLGAATADPTMVERFLREGEAAARIRHEHIVDVTDVGAIDGHPYLVMEFLDGEPLSALIEREAPLPARRLVDLALPIIAALAAAHDAGVVHRDLKPENIFLARSRRGDLLPKLVDFGISRIDAISDADARRLTGSAVLMGTPCYMAPEQARGARFVDTRSDQFSLGVVLFECATGNNPFLRESLFGIMSAILTDAIPAPSAMHAPVDPGLDAVIHRAMSRDPSARYADMRAVGAALLPFASLDVAAHWARDLAPVAGAGALTLGGAPTDRPPAPPPPRPTTLADGTPLPPAPAAVAPMPRSPVAPVAAVALVAVVAILTVGVWLAVAASASRPPPVTRVAAPQSHPVVAPAVVAPTVVAPAADPTPPAAVPVVLAPAVDPASVAVPGHQPSRTHSRTPPARGAATTPPPAAPAPSPATPGGTPAWQIRTNF